MKNKKKLAKFSTNKGSQSSVLTEWFYMNDREIAVRDIMNVFVDNKAISSEIWEEAGVLELTLISANEEDNHHTLEFEQTEPDLGDEYSNNFLKEKNVQTLFYVTIDQSTESSMKDMMHQIVTAIGGFFCGDTDDFTPRIP